MPVAVTQSREKKTIAEAARRLKEELGFTTDLQKAFDFLYTAAFENGLTENEFDHVYTGIYEDVVNPDPLEVMDYCFKPMEVIRKELIESPQIYTAWFIIAFPKLEEYMKEGIIKAGY